MNLFSGFPSTEFLDEEALQYFSTAIVRGVTLVEVAAVVENLGNVTDEGLQRRIGFGIHTLLNRGKVWWNKEK